MKHVKIGSLTVGNDLPLLVIAGPCQLESLDHAQMIAGRMQEDVRRRARSMCSKPAMTKPTAPR